MSTEDLSGVQYNIDLATRQVEINEWAYEDKMDTVFVFQIVFMSILFLIILFYLKETGLFPSSFVWYVVVVLAFVVGLIIINRAVYTANRRDKRYWNRRRFNEDNIKESPVRPGDKSYLDYLDAVRAKYGGRSGACPANCVAASK